MKIDRRRFVQTGGVATAALATGCDQLPSIELFGRSVPAPPAPPYRVPDTRAIDLVSHALNRLTFGARPWDYHRVAGLGETEEESFYAFVEEQLAAEKIDDPAGYNAARQFDTLGLPVGELFEYQEKLLLRELTEATLLRAVYSERQLYEVMVQFWTDHFNIDSSKGDCKWLKVADDREVIRKHALGTFPELLEASARSPAMLWYLDGRVNRKRNAEEKPNENYARELLELHTLGVNSGYTQEDVMEVARCLTGWTIKETGRSRFGIGTIEFKPHLHDCGDKVVMGQTINGFSKDLAWDEQIRLGSDELAQVLKIIALHEHTARYIATKLCRRFIADEPPEQAVATVAKWFLDSDGDIRQTLRSLFHSDEFKNTRGNKLKRPFNYLASTLRATNAKTDGKKRITDFLVRMGHSPYQFPTPDGYPEEAGPWLGTLLWRWNFAARLVKGELKGTKIDKDQLRHSFDTKLQGAAALFGRTASRPEIEELKANEEPLALALASPGFQMC